MLSRKTLINVYLLLMCHSLEHGLFRAVKRLKLYKEKLDSCFKTCIMQKMIKFTAITMTALWFFNIACNVSAVLCIDNYGAISIETAIQNKCLCSGGIPANTNANKSSIEDAGCKDIPFAINALAELQKRFIASNSLMPALIQKPSSELIKSLQHSLVPSFYRTYFDPLSSVILTI